MKFTGILEAFAESQRIKEEIEIRRINKQLDRDRRRMLASPHGSYFSEITAHVRAEIRREK